MKKIVLLLFCLCANMALAEPNWQYVNSNPNGDNYLDINSVKRYVNSPIVSLKIKTVEKNPEFDRMFSDILIDCQKSKFATSHLVVYEMNEYMIPVKFVDKKTNFNIVNPDSLWKPFEYNSLGHILYKKVCGKK